MIIDPYGRILSETWKAAEDMVTADLDLALLEHATGRRWIRTRRPELYGELAVSTGQEVEIGGVQGNFEANGTFTITVVDGDRFSLDGSDGT